MSIDEIQDEITEEFSFFDDWMDKYEYLISLGKNIPIIEDRYKDEDHLIKGCQSRVWLHAREVGDVVEYSADSDTIVTKGIIGLLIRVLQKAKDIAAADIYFIDKIGLREHLSSTRSNGLVSMLKQMKMYSAVLAQQ